MRRGSGPGGWLGLILLAALGAPVRAADYYVAPAGSDANPGTIDKPLKTPDIAARKLMPGDTLHFRAGTYRCRRNGVIGLAPWRSGEPGKPITFTAYRDERVVIDCGRSQWGFTPNGFSYIVIDGFEIVARGQYGMKISAHHGRGGAFTGHHVTVRNCDIHHTPSEVLFAANTPYLTVENCHLHHSGRSHGLYFSGKCDHAVIRGVLSEENHGNSGMQLNASHTGLRGALVENCVLRNNAQGLSLMGAIGCTFRNNVLFNNGYAGPRGSGNREVILWTYGRDPAKRFACKDNVFENNTIVNLRNKHLFHVKSGTTGTVIRRNVLFTGKNVVMTFNANSVAGTVIADNGLFNAGSTQVAVVGKRREYFSLDAFAARYKVKAGGNRFADPLFVSLTAGDLRLSAKSPCPKAGVDWSLLPIAPGHRLGPRWRKPNPTTRPRPN